MYAVHKPVIKVEGPFAMHDQACAVMTGEQAVYNLSSGIFTPSRKARELGFHLVHADTRFKRFLIKWFFKDG